MHKANYTLMGFLTMAFLVVGLTGMVATYVAPVALERTLLREAALDAAQAAADGPDPRAAIEALRARLDDSAEKILPTGGDATPAALVARIGAERLAMRARMRAEAGETTQRLRLMIVVVTVMAAAFGAAMLHVAGRAGGRGEEFTAETRRTRRRRGESKG